MTTAVRAAGPALIHERIAEFVDLYRQTYAEPPYLETDADADAFGARLLEESGRQGFALVMTEKEGEIIGFAHGFTFGPDQWWKAADTRPAAVQGHSKFAIMELVVRRDQRGNGLSSRLIHALLHERAEPYATLCTNPLAPARAVYEHWGWTYVGNTSARPTFPSMHILLLPLAVKLRVPITCSQDQARRCGFGS